MLERVDQRSLQPWDSAQRGGKAGRESEMFRELFALRHGEKLYIRRSSSGLVRAEIVPVDVLNGLHHHHRPSPRFVQTSLQPSIPPCRSSATDSPCLPRRLVCSSSVALRTLSSSPGPLRRTRMSAIIIIIIIIILVVVVVLVVVVIVVVEGKRQGRETLNVLLSIRYGIPNTKPNPTTAIRIIGFLSRSNGETVRISIISITSAIHPTPQPPPPLLLHSPPFISLFPHSLNSNSIPETENVHPALAS